MSLIRHALLVSIILTVIPAQFNIPLPFGGISLNKNKNGEVRKLGRKEKKTTFSWKLAEIKTSICLVGEQIETSN